MRVAPLRSFRAKLLVLVALATSVGVLVVSATMRLIEVMEVRPTALSELSTDAAVIATHSAASLTFDDRKAATETLAALQALPKVVAARIFDRSGALFSKYERAGEPLTPPAGPAMEGHRFEDNRLTLSRAIMHESDHLGTLMMVYDLSEYYRRIRRNTIISLVICVIAVGASLLLALRLQRGLARPVRELIDTSHRISQSNDYSLRATCFEADELGDLTASFNTMIARIEERDSDLVKVRRALEDSNEQLQQFAYVASHDLQEPLRMVASYLQLLEKRYGEKFEGEAREFFAFAVDGAKRMQRLINDLLEYSRVNSQGKPAARVESNAIVEEAIQNLSAAIAESGAQVTHDDLPVIDVDRTQMTQLFQNLIGNAIKFHGDDPPRVHLSVQRNGSNWRFSVKDNGIGIDRRYADRLFVIFQRLHDRSRYEGTGIGLAVCKRIVERHGGKIWFESEVGHGTTFLFTITIGNESRP